MLGFLTLVLALAAGDSASVYRGDRGQLDVAPPRVEAPDVRIDGRLDEPEWRSAAVLAGFTQFEPVEGEPASEQTEVLVFYAADAIYFGVRARDSRPDLVRATLTDRDRSIFSDDWIRVMLDTYDDRRQAYVFYVNPLGIQTDGLWVEGAPVERGRGFGLPIDFNPDFIWDSFGRTTEDGWVAEIRIPYVSLRFREAAVQSWGINVARETRRDGFKQAWAPVTKDNPSTLAQSGRLVSLRGLEPRRLMEVNPVLTGSRTGARNDADRFVHDRLRSDFGLNGRYGLTRNLVLDATYNPDFSQVEADADQIAVNERFALFFAEKRPFFLDGTEIFNTPQRLVHTRSITDPIGGAKLTGKLGTFNVGYLGALDDSPLDDTGERAAFNLLRLRRDIGSGSNVGVLYTDRTLTGGGHFNRVLGVDGRFVLGRYTVTTQVAESWTRTGDKATRAPLLHAQVERSGRTFGWGLLLEDVGDDFRARSGFIRRPGDAQLRGEVRFTRFGRPGAFIESTSAELSTENFFDHDALWRARAPMEGELQFMSRVALRGRHSVTLVLRDGYFDFAAAGGFQDYQVAAPEGPRPFAVPGAARHLRGLALFPRLTLGPSASLSGRFMYREVPVYAEASRGLELYAGPELRFNTTGGLGLEASFTRSRIERADGSTFSTADVARMRAQYQVSRAVLARAVAQYNLSSRDALRDPRSGLPLLVGGRAADARQRGDFGIQLLLAYEPSPGTIVYAGYSRQIGGDLSTYRLDSMEPRNDGIFLKLSYLFRV